MLTLLLLLAVYGGWRAVHAAIETVRALPRNEDMIFY
jgi:hypothetical protein